MEYGAFYANSKKNELVHHGILGQKWGVRRYQNEDGSLTPEGKKRYGKGLLKKREVYEDQRDIARGREKFNKSMAKPMGAAGGVIGGLNAMNAAYNAAIYGGTNAALAGIATTSTAAATALAVPYAAVGAAVVGGSVYGSYKVAQAVDRALANHSQKKMEEIEKMLK